MGAIGLAGALLIFYEGRGTTFFFDEWNFILQRRTGGLESLLLPHNGHFSLIPALAYKVMLAAFGLTNYPAFRILVIAVHLLCVGLLFVYSSRKVHPVLAVAFSSSLLLLGSAWEDLLWPFQIGYLGSLAGFLGALLLLEKRSARADAGASLCALASLACSGLGVPVVAAMAVEMVLSRRYRRLWVPLAPAFVYGLWYLGYGHSEIRPENVPLTPKYFVYAAGGAAGGLGGLAPKPGMLVLASLGLLWIYAVVRSRNLDPRLIALAAAPAFFWVAQGLARAHGNEPAASRYLYPGGLFLLLIAVQALSKGPRIPWFVALMMAVPIAVGVNRNLDTLRSGASGLRATSDFVMAELSAVELLGDRAARDFRPDPNRMPQVDAGSYLQAVDELGSPAYPVGRLVRRPRDVLEAADGVLLAAEAAGTSTALTVRSVTGASVSQSQGCTAFSRTGDLPAGAELSLSGGRVMVTSLGGPVEVRAIRFARTFPVTPVFSVGPGEARSLALPAIRTSRQWRVALASERSFSVCAG